MLASCSQGTADGGQQAELGQTGSIVLSLGFDRDESGLVTNALVEIGNASASPICVSYNYAASTRLSSSTGSAAVPAPDAFEGRPQPGCVEITPGEHLRASYDLRALYPDADRENLRVCYELPWHEGGHSDAGFDQMARICEEAGQRAR